MVIDGTQFNKRAHLIINALRSGGFKNRGDFARLLNCSINTAGRVIDRLILEHDVPIKYDNSNKGYYLTDISYEMPQLLPPGKDEQAALLTLSHFSNLIGSADLHDKLSEIWNKFGAENSNFTARLEELTRYFSCDSTAIGIMSDHGVLEYLSYAQKGENLKVIYKSPWRHDKEKEYRGRILKVHYSDGNLYLLFRQDTGREFVLNSSFVKEVTVLNYDIEMKCTDDSGKSLKAYNWLEGFGIWAGEDLQEVEIRILPPASEYYAKQIWNESQEDSWDSTVLVRKFMAILSPELVRRILSLGSYIDNIKPDNLKASVLKEARELLGLLN